MIVISGMFILNIESSNDNKSPTTIEDKQTNDSQKPHSRHNSDEALAGNDDKKQKVEESSLNFSITGNSDLLLEFPMTTFSIPIQEIRSIMRNHNHFVGKFDLEEVKDQARTHITEKHPKFIKTRITEDNKEDTTKLSFDDLINAAVTSNICYISFEKNNNISIDILLNTKAIKTKEFYTLTYDEQSILSENTEEEKSTHFSEDECLVLKIVFNKLKKNRKRKSPKQYANRYKGYTLKAIYPYTYPQNKLPEPLRESDTPSYKFSFLQAEIKIEKN